MILFVFFLKKKIMQHIGGEQDSKMKEDSVELYMCCLNELLHCTWPLNLMMVIDDSMLRSSILDWNENYTWVFKIK